MDSVRLKAVEKESKRIKELQDMLAEKLDIFVCNEGACGFEYDRNINASRTAILNQITTLRNELLELARCFK